MVALLIASSYLRTSILSVFYVFTSSLGSLPPAREKSWPLIHANCWELLANQCKTKGILPLPIDEYELIDTKICLVIEQMHSIIEHAF